MRNSAFLFREDHSASCGARGPTRLLATPLLPTFTLSPSPVVSSSAWPMVSKGEGAVVPGDSASSWPSLEVTRPTGAIQMYGAMRHTVSVASTWLNLSGRGECPAWCPTPSHPPAPCFPRRAAALPPTLGGFPSPPNLPGPQFPHLQNGDVTESTSCACGENYTDISALSAL